MLDEGADADAQEAAAITEYNGLLASNLASFTASNTGVKANLVNTTIAFQTAIDNPQAYGAANATCYDDDGTTCLWWNNYHPALASEYSSPFARSGPGDALSRILYMCYLCVRVAYPRTLVQSHVFIVGASIQVTNHSR